MNAEGAIRHAQAVAKRNTIRERLLAWIDKADGVDIIAETPGMDRDSCSALANWVPTGELTITLKLTGIDSTQIDAILIDGGDRWKKDHWRLR